MVKHNEVCLNNTEGKGAAWWCEASQCKVLGCHHHEAFFLKLLNVFLDLYEQYKFSFILTIDTFTYVS